MVKYWRRLSQQRRDEGATAVEYGLLVALIAVVLAVGAVALGNALSDRLEAVGECVEEADGDFDEDCSDGGGDDDGGDGDVE
jgi:pilus assembly protein Flp/PilA